MKQGMIAMILTVVLVTVLATAALAQPDCSPRAPRAGGGHWDGPPAEWGEDRLGPLAEALDLTDEQKAAIEELHEKARAERAELRKQIARTRHELQGEWLEDEPDEGRVLELTEDLGELRTRLQVLRVKTRLAVHAQLTPEQRDQWLSARPREGRHGRHGGCWMWDGSCRRAPRPQDTTR
ncbi:MAG TPA: Spy/CpxP family protein refolding chaperone [Candidatus Krumholzibacteria bacterium]|nr:Spy/CpxP family protein refolding chaperone [Candidatus Krumholzibacteria bacterium]HPD71943.1 Spy/CpxP family protein refolding chaperone [Candidatus Krumholzibacteria bacterium]HRY41124.1 Spy/CpxP family protein refolding chaperone [Candidatus Krumholzibacteria bacterium]